MAYGSDAEDEGLSAADQDPGTAGGDTANDDSVSQQYTDFETAFNVGSQKNGQTVKGGGGESTLKGQQSTDRLIDPQLPAIDSPIKSPTSSRPLQQTQKQVAAAGSRAKYGSQEYDTPLEKEGVGGFLSGLFGGDKKDRSAAEEEAKYGEFSQIQFNAKINEIDNPLANRSSLPPEIAADIAMNPFSKRASDSEKAIAAVQSVAPFGSIVGIGRAMGMSRDWGGTMPSGPPGNSEDGENAVINPIPRRAKVATTKGSGNKPDLLVADRNTIRRARRNTTRRI